MKSLALGIATFALGLAFSAADLRQQFVNPPDAARPGVYWYFMDGNQSRDGMVKDLEAMAEVGIGSVLFLEVNLGMPAGPIPFMSEVWQDNLVHAIRTADKLGIEVILGTGPGWAGSGGSWVKPEQSMQHLVASNTAVEGPQLFEANLPVPAPRSPNRFAGMNDGHRAERERWYQDVVVLAVPTPKDGGVLIAEADMKTLKDVRPYSIDKSAPLFVMPEAVPAEPDAQKLIDPTRVIDLSAHMKPDGTLRWEVPAGKWTIMRFVARSTGQTTRPAPRSGHGFECDKFSEDAYRQHWASFQAKLLEKLGPMKPGRGLTTIHLDSWEMSSQNWSASLREEFKVRRGYDPQPYYPAFMGLVVGSAETTERFLWDLRKTAQELVMEKHAGAIKGVAHENGLLYSNEPYDMNPAGNIDLGSVADIPACEFWNALDKVDAQYSCIEAVSIAHTMGKSRVNAESFTTHGLEYFNYPGNMKNQTDWAFAMGINGILFHTYQHQPLGDDVKPGMAMGPYGVHWHRNLTFWHLLPAYHQYIARCSQVMRQGGAVADVLYLTPEGAPHIFEAPQSALAGSGLLKDKRGYNFDAVTSRILGTRAQMKNGMISFEGGSQYRLLVLPQVETMTPEALRVVTGLVEQGATVIGNPVVKSPSLSGYPGCDREVQQLAARLWGDTPQAERAFGKGRILLAKAMPAKVKNIGPQSGDALYPSYDETAQVLKQMGVPEDFKSNAAIRYGHRRTASEDMYFVSNTLDQAVVAECSFRVDSGRPELWDPVTGEMRLLNQFTRNAMCSTMSLAFAPHQSFFVVFVRDGGKATLASAQPNIVNPGLHTTLEGAWEVSFDPKWGGSENVRFDKLADWTTHEERGIKYYSGSASYRKTFDFDGGKSKRVWVDLGVVHDIARVTLNGKDCGIVWCAPWRVEITDALKPQGNVLEIEVVNRWRNRLLGDSQDPDKAVRTLQWNDGLLGGKAQKAGRYTFATYFPKPGEKQLLPSGLLGPVSLLVVDR